MEVVSKNTLPEVQQFDTLRRCICEDVLLQEALRKLRQCGKRENITYTDPDGRPLQHGKCCIEERSPAS
jgi:hypothetical protein